MVPDRIGDVEAATVIDTQRHEDLFRLDASSNRMILLPALDVMEETRNHGSGKERFDHGLTDASPETLREDNGTGIPCNGFAVTEPVRALQL